MTPNAISLVLLIDWSIKMDDKQETLRRTRNSEERRTQILEGALRVFSSKGFVQATNKDIAEAAGINSPGLIYHYFKDKADLLRAVIEQFAPPVQILTHAAEISA